MLCKHTCKRRHCEHLLYVASEHNMHSALPTFTPAASPTDNDTINVPEELIASETDRPAPLPLSAAQKKIFRDFDDPEKLPKEGLIPKLAPGLCCEKHGLRYNDKPTFLREADVFLSRKRTTTKLFAWDCPQHDPDCQRQFDGSELGLWVCTKQTIVSEFLFYDCFVQVLYALFTV